MYSKNGSLISNPSRTRSDRNREAGFSLIEIMIGVGILGVVAVGMMTMMVNVARESKAASQKLATLDLIKSLATSITSGKNLCNFAVVTTPAAFTFASAVFPPSSIPISGLYMDAAGTDAVVVAGTRYSNSSLDIVSMDFSNIVLAGPNRYTAVLTVNVAGLRSMKPVVTRVMLDTVVAGSNTSLNGCTTVALSGNGVAPTNQTACEAAGGLWIAAGNFCYFDTANNSIDWY